VQRRIQKEELITIMETDRSVMATEDHKTAAAEQTDREMTETVMAVIIAVARVMAMLRIVRVVTDLLQVMTALTEAMADRRIDSAKISRVKDMFRKHR
jgi:cell division protein FtsL